MPRQVGTYGTPRADLGAALAEYPLQPQGLIGTQILPVFGTQKQKAAFSVITRESILRARQTRRAARSSYSRDGFDTDNVTYECEEHGHEQPLDDSERAMYASDFDAEMTSAAMALNVLMREQEKRIAAQIFDATTNWPSGTAALYTDITGGDDWDVAAADVIAEVETAKQQIRTNCGMLPNTMVISAKHLKSFKLNTGILGAIQYTQTVTDAVIAGQLPALFGIERILFAGGVYDSADEGASMSLSDIWSDDYCWLGVCARSQMLAEPCVGRTMLWTADSPENATVEEYYEQQTRSWIYRARQHVDEKVFDPYFGHLLKIDS